MKHEEIAAALRKYIHEKFNVPEDDADFNDGVNLFDYGYLDSFGAVELTSFVEKNFGIVIRQSDLVAYPMNSIEEISSFVEKRQAGEI